MTLKLINASFLEAVTLGDKDKVKSILKDKRYDLGYDISGYKVLMVAIEYNHKHIIQLLLKKTTIDKVKLLEILKILVVVKPGWIDVIERLIDVGAEVEMQNKSGDTVIHVAFDNVTSHGIIDVLLKRYLKKSCKNLVNSRGISLLHIACTRMNLIVVKKLLDANPPAMINGTDAMSLYTPLHYAVKRNRHQVARYLIKRGADLYKLDRNGSTPLHWALWHHNASMINLIISLDLRRENIVNIYGLSHFMAACIGNDANIAKNYLQALLEHPKFSIRDLITSKILNFGGLTGYTPLHFAVKFGKISIVELLLRYGADCCNVAGNHLTPHLLARYRGYGGMKGLLETHCDLVNKCRVMRAQDPDFKKWGEEYEEHIVMERVMTFKHLCETHQNLIRCSIKSFDLSNKCCESEFLSTDFQNELDLFCTW